MKLLYPFAKRFIAGYNFETASVSIDNLIQNGYGVTIDYVGEMSKTKSDVLKAYKEYEKILTKYNNIDISVKPSQFGLLFNKPYCYDMLNSINQLACYTSNTVRLDMEDSRVTDDTIEIAVKYQIGCAIQANHPDTLSNMHTLIKNNIPIRLVKGAYKEKISHIYDVRKYFLKYANMPSNKESITIATHDEIILDKLLHHNNYEFLYGIRRDVQEKYKNDGKQVTIYVPYGENWMPYTLRRLKEWKNLKFVIGNIIKERLNNFML